MANNSKIEWKAASGTNSRGKSMPLRIQRRRTKGWRMPSGVIYVGRPSRWGNPWPSTFYGRAQAVALYRTWWATTNAAELGYNATEAHHLDDLKAMLRRDLHTLRGKNLACWCPIDQPCHADVLLELANCLEATP